MKCDFPDALQFILAQRSLLAETGAPSYKFATLDSRRCASDMLATATEYLMEVRQLAPLRLSDDERPELKALTTRRKTAQALALRARIVLACAEGGQNTEVAARLGLDRATVGKWRWRFVERCATWAGCTMSRDLERRARLTMRASKPLL
jgi:FixJ family two-component response regulator